jgi:hypothetical protein
MKNPQALQRAGSGKLVPVLLPTAGSGGCGLFFEIFVSLR